MFFQKIILKKKWPLLKLVSFQSVGGLYTKHGEDLLLNVLLYSHFRKNPNSHIVEVDKPENFPFSLATEMVLGFNCVATLVSTEMNKALLVSNQVNENIETLNLDLESIKKFGCNALSNKKISLTTYDDESSLIKIIASEPSIGIHVITPVSMQSIQLLESLMLTTKVFSVLLLNNNCGLFKCGDDEIRRKIERNGLVYCARLNGQADYFILSELMNGFPGYLAPKLKMHGLMRWISAPPDFDYMKPR